MSPSKRKAGRDLRARALSALQKRKRALHVAELRGRLGMDRGEQHELLALLESLAAEGVVTKLPGSRFRAAKVATGGTKQQPPAGARGKRRADRGPMDEREGKLTVNARGFGFVVTDEEGPDVFVPAAELGGAMHGDRVRVLVEQGERGLSGTVVGVVERANHYLGGHLHLSERGAWLEADDERLRVPVRIQGELPDDAGTGTGVIAEIVAYPAAPGEPLEARVIEAFDPADRVELELRRILLREQIVDEFPEDVRAEAAQLPHAVSSADKRARADLRRMPLVTIDPSDARDHDDAVWAEHLADGGFRVVVAIADVAHYVPEGSALDREARARGCTLYLPSRAVPMLPAELSSHLASLVPNRDRLAVAVDIELGPGGAVRKHRFMEAVIRSHARLSYEGVARALGLSEGPSQPAAEALKPLLSTLLDVATVLGRHRRRRGSLNFDLPEAKVKLDDRGRPVDIVRSRKDPGVARAYNLIEELMLLANEVVATALAERGLPTIYRVHGEPDPDRVESFRELATSLGYRLDDDVGTRPKALARFLRRIEGTPHAGPLGYLLLRAMQQATYQTDNVGHFALAASHYLHFTSPIRRYPDLAVHRIVKQVARGGRVRSEAVPGTLAAQAAEASELERKALSIEREVVDLYGTLLMRERIGEDFDATITGVSDHGFYASLESPFVDVLCRVASLPRDRYQLDPHGVRLEGLLGGHTFALGDSVRVRIEDVSIAQRKITAVPIDVAAGGAERSEGAPPGGQRRRAKQERAERRQANERRQKRDARRKKRVVTRKHTQGGRGGRR